MEEIYLDLLKGQLNTSKLVKKPIQVHGESGKVFTRMQWVDPHTGETHTTRPHSDGNRDVLIRKPRVAPLGLRHTNHDMPEQTVRERHGEIGPLNLSLLNEGTPVQKTFKADFKEIKKDYDWKDEDIDPIEYFKNIFKDTTTEGFNYIFSHPDGEYTAKLDTIGMYDEEEGHISAELNFDLIHKSGEKMGMVSRSVHRDKDGLLHVHNNVVEVDEKFQGTGVGTHIYERAEQYWKHISDGHPVSIETLADISIGVYAWSRKGFDFANEHELKKARQEFVTFCKANKLPLTDTLMSCGYITIDDLHHASQFGSLNDGKTYYLLETKKTEFNRERNQKEVKGTGHLGKAFMLGGKSDWNAIKMLNTNKQEE